MVSVVRQMFYEHPKKKTFNTKTNIYVIFLAPPITNTIMLIYTHVQ